MPTTYNIVDVFILHISQLQTYSAKYNSVVTTSITIALNST